MIINIFYLFILFFSSVGHAIETNTEEFIRYTELYGKWYGVDPISLQYVYKMEFEENNNYKDYIQDFTYGTLLLAWDPNPNAKRLESVTAKTLYLLTNAVPDDSLLDNLEEVRQRILLANQEDIYLQNHDIQPPKKNHTDFIFTSLGPVEFQIRTAYRFSTALKSKAHRSLVLDQHNQPKILELIQVLSLRNTVLKHDYTFWKFSLELLAAELSYFQKTYLQLRNFNLYGNHSTLLELHRMGGEIYRARHSKAVAQALEKRKKKAQPIFMESIVSSKNFAVSSSVHTSSLFIPIALTPLTVPSSLKFVEKSPAGQKLQGTARKAGRYSVQTSP